MLAIVVFVPIAPPRPHPLDLAAIGNTNEHERCTLAARHAMHSPPNGEPAFARRNRTPVHNPSYA